jgi:hypothetical protein
MDTYWGIENRIWSNRGYRVTVRGLGVQGLQVIRLWGYMGIEI